MTLILDRVDVPTALGAAVHDAIDNARSRGGAVLLSVVTPLADPADPLGFLAGASAALGSGILWTQTDGAAFAGAGSAFAIRGAGVDRFEAMTSELEHIRGRLVTAGPAAPFPVLGGFSFFDDPGPQTVWRGFPDARLVVPSVLLQRTDGPAALRVTVAVTPDSSPAALNDELAKLTFLGRTWANPPAAIDELAPVARSRRVAGHRAGFSPLPNPCQPGPSGSGTPDTMTRSSTTDPGRPVVGRKSVPDRQIWESSVSDAVSMIRQGKLDKVVLAREERIGAQEPFSALATLRRLRAADPGATVFAMQSGDAWFLGATPERLVRLDRGRVDVTCLAGSIGIGESEEERQALAAQLLTSDKDRREHEIVVASTLAALREVCASVERAAGTPRVVTARSVQHLATPVTGSLAAGGQILDLVARLHPTPAVGGFPRDRALAVIRELEAIERGWYAGPFGWTDLDGSGEFSVAIRSALLRGWTASVFAGCGIVAGSDPAAEFAETCLKMRPMLAALGVA